MKKKWDLSVESRRRLVQRDHADISIRRQCELLGLTRSSLYYASQGERDENLELMRLIDEQYTATPFYGVRRMTAWLRQQGYHVNHKRVTRLMRQMGLAALFPGQALSRRNSQHRIYPYLLRGVKIRQVNQVWSARISRTSAYSMAVCI